MSIESFAQTVKQKVYAERHIGGEVLAACKKSAASPETNESDVTIEAIDACLPGSSVGRLDCLISIEANARPLAGGWAAVIRRRLWLAGAMHFL
jgi:hypothetical protein